MELFSGIGARKRNCRKSRQRLYYYYYDYREHAEGEGVGSRAVFYRVCAAANTLTIVCTLVVARRAAGFSVSLAIIARTHTLAPPPRSRRNPRRRLVASSCLSLVGHPSLGMATLSTLVVLALFAGQQVRAHLGGRMLIMMKILSVALFKIYFYRGFK
jgi:hypothetical protein